MKPGFWCKFRDVVALFCEENAFPQEVEFRAAVHLSFDRFEAIDVSFDATGIVGHGQPVDDGGVIVSQAGGERVQGREVVGVDLGDPVVEVFAVQAGEDLGELGDVVASACRWGQRPRASSRRAWSSGSRWSGSDRSDPDHRPHRLIRESAKPERRVRPDGSRAHFLAASAAGKTRIGRGRCAGPVLAAGGSGKDHSHR
jgi:hypothetical protein